jgi:hypothetical protein
MAPDDPFFVQRICATFPQPCAGCGMPVRVVAEGVFVLSQAVDAIPHECAPPRL